MSKWPFDVSDMVGLPLAGGPNELNEVGLLFDCRFTDAILVHLKVFKSKLYKRAVPFS